MNKDILIEIWKAPVFVYNFGNCRCVAIGDGALWNISMNGIIYGAYCSYYEKSDNDLVNEKILGGNTILGEIIRQFEKIKSKTPCIRSYDKFIEIIKENQIDIEDLEKQYKRISRLRKSLLW